MSNTGNYCSGRIPEFNGGCSDEPQRMRGIFGHEALALGIEAVSQDLVRPIEIDFNIPAPSDCKEVNLLKN